MRIEVVYALNEQQQELIELELNKPQATVLMALQYSGLLEKHKLDANQLDCGIWNRQANLEHILREGDRVEIYRPLLIDPKDARRLRAKRKQ